MSSPTDKERSDPLQALVAEALERYDEEGEPGLEAVCARHPGHAQKIRELVQRFDATGLLGRGSATPTLPEQLDDFRLLEPLGKGGMGAVYLAEQVSLGRQVAIKVVRPELLWFEGARERFRREVEAVARLQHPGIVPVLAVGEDGGIPWYTMERVDGCSLQQLVDILKIRNPSRLSGEDVCRVVRGDAHQDTPVSETLTGSYTEVVTRLVQQVAEAVHHAHLRGIVHRDLKPSNIMVTGAGVAQVVDFGLAHVRGSPQLTRTGAIVGSPAYMSPEQVRGQVVDARTDVYSLGVTLYEVLALRQPFLGDDDDEVRVHVLAGTYPRLRTHNAAVSRDLEVVCMTAMDLDRERRYGDMAGFADDLQRCLQRRPIRARPPGFALRTVRFFQRHRALGAATAVAALFLVLLPLLLWTQQRAASRELEAERQRTERNLDIALKAVDNMMDNLANEQLWASDELRLTWERFYRETIGALEQLEGSEKGRRMQAAGLLELARVLKQYDRHAEAQGLIHRALDIWGSIDELSPKDLMDREVAHTLLAQSLRAQGRLDEAAGQVESVVMRLESLLARREPGAPGRIVPMHCRTLALLAMVRFEQRRLDEGLALARRSSTIARGLFEAGNDRAGHDLALALMIMGCQLVNSEPTKAEALLSEAIRLTERLPNDSDHPVGGSAVATVAIARSYLGRCLLVQGRLDDAEKQLRTNVSYIEAELRKRPGSLSTASDLAADLAKLSTVALRRARYDDALKLIDRAIHLQRTAHEMAPDVERYCRLLGKHLMWKATCLLCLAQPVAMVANAEELAKLPVPRAPLMTAHAMLMAVHAVRKHGLSGDEIQEREWLRRAARLLVSAEESLSGYDGLLESPAFDLLRDAPEAGPALKRLRARRRER